MSTVHTGHVPLPLPHCPGPVTLEAWETPVPAYRMSVGTLLSAVASRCTQTARRWRRILHHDTKSVKQVWKEHVIKEEQNVLQTRYWEDMWNIAGIATEHVLNRKKRCQRLSNKMRLYTVYYISVNWSTCLAWYLHPTSEAYITVITASGTVRPFLLPCAIVEQLELVSSNCSMTAEDCRNGLTVPDAVITVLYAPDNGRRYHPKHVEQFTEI